MTTKTFTVAGITELHGVVKVRFTNDIVLRVKRLEKYGATRIDFVDLPTEMTKIEALKYMLTCKQFQSPEDQATLENTLEDKEKDARRRHAKLNSVPSLISIRRRPRKNTTVSDILEAING